MSVFDELAKIEANLANVTAPDLSTLATAAEVAALSAKLDALTMSIGTPPAVPVATAS